VIGNNILLTKMWACVKWSLPKTVQTPEGRQVLIVLMGGGPDMGVSSPGLKSVAMPVAGALKRGGERNGLESGQVSEGATDSRNCMQTLH